MIQAKKSLGQHFLNSKHALMEIIRAADLRSGQIVLEIGPGTGILTEELLKTGIKLIAVEKDDRAIELLNKKFSIELNNGSLKLVHGDILDENLDLGLEKQNFSVVANIPYYITGAILEKFLEKGPQPDQMILLVQKEVAERIISRDGKESVLSISVKAFGKPSLVANVPRGAFIPAPKVDSAILKIADINDSFFHKNGLNTGNFFTMIKAGFAHKRKYLARNLESLYSKGTVMKAWNDLKIDPKIRPEDLNIDQWMAINKALNTASVV